MQGPLDAGPVVVPERADVLDDERQVRLDDLAVEQPDLLVRESRFGPPAQVHDDFDECGAIGQGVNGRNDLGRQRRQQRVEIVDRFPLALFATHVVLQ